MLPIAPTLRNAVFTATAGFAVTSVLQAAGPALSAAATGTIEGRVVFDGAVVPTPTAVSNTTDPEVCGRTHTLEDLLVSPENRGIQHAIVALEGSGLPATASPSQPLTIDNRDCRFTPHASVMTAGGTIEMRNSDPTLHTVHLYGPMEINVALPLNEMRVRRTIDALGLIAVKCDVHGWMQAFIRVDPHPFHAVTDATGAFRLDGVPPGEHTLSVWHEKLGTRETKVTVAAGEVTRLRIGMGGG